MKYFSFSLFLFKGTSSFAVKFSHILKKLISVLVVQGVMIPHFLLNQRMAQIFLIVLEYADFLLFEFC